MIKGTSSHVIGRDTPRACELLRGSYEDASFSTNQRAVFPQDHELTEFRQMTAWVTLVTPPIVIFWLSSWEEHRLH